VPTLAAHATFGASAELVVVQSIAATDPRASAIVEHARAIAEIRHPSIAKVRAVELRDGEWSIFTAFVEGETLAALRRSGSARLPLVIELRVLVDLLGAVSAIHAVGRAHGAIVAENVVLGPDGGARLVQHAALRSSDAPADRADDLRAVGAMLWEALGGRAYEAGSPDPEPPADAPWASGLVEVARAAIASDPSVSTAPALVAAIKKVARSNLATSARVSALVKELGGAAIAARRKELAPKAFAQAASARVSGLRPKPALAAQATRPVEPESNLLRSARPSSAPPPPSQWPLDRSSHEIDVLETGEIIEVTEEAPAPPLRPTADQLTKPKLSKPAPPKPGPSKPPQSRPAGAKPSQPPARRASLPPPPFSSRPLTADDSSTEARVAILEAMLEDEDLELASDSVPQAAASSEPAPQVESASAVDPALVNGLDKGSMSTEHAPSATLSADASGLVLTPPPPAAAFAPAAASPRTVSQTFFAEPPEESATTERSEPGLESPAAAVPIRLDRRRKIVLGVTIAAALVLVIGLLMPRRRHEASIAAPERAPERRAAEAPVVVAPSAEPSEPPARAEAAAATAATAAAAETAATAAATTATEEPTKPKPAPAATAPAPRATAVVAATAPPVAAPPRPVATSKTPAPIATTGSVKKPTAPSKPRRPYDPSGI
jgi:serine/threonine protein kinase